MEGVSGRRGSAWGPREEEEWMGPGEEWTGAALVLC